MMNELPPLREVIEEFDLAVRKSLGQHFLLDLNITRKIARLADVKSGDIVLEIGPGPGGLTRALLEAGAKVIAIERDHRCIEALAELTQHYPNRFNVIEADARAVNEPEILSGERVKIIANLPYNISTELLVKWLKAGPALWSVMALMFQREVADRILAPPGSKTYGRLSVIAQALSTPSRGFDLPARAFTPPPKVDSTILLFEAPAKPFAHIHELETITQGAFSQRRKMLRSSLKPVFGDVLKEALESAGLKQTQRAEEVTVGQYKALSEFYAVNTS